MAKMKNLTLADLTAPREVRSAELDLGGDKRRIHYRPMSTGDALKMMRLMGQDVDPAEMAEAALAFAQRYVVKPGGAPLFSAETVLEVPLEYLVEVVGAIAGAGQGEGAEGDAGNA